MADSTEAITRISADSALKNSALPDPLKDPPVNRHTPAIIPRPTTDTVALSDTAKATLLRDEGDTVEEIASELNLSVSQIISDLQLAKTATQTAAVASVEAGTTKKQSL